VRPLEILLLGTEAAVLILLLIPLRRRLRALRYAGVLLAPVAVVQALIEDRRWQMIPADALIGVLLVLWLLGPRPNNGRAPQSRRARRLVAGATAVLGLFGMAAAIAPPALFPVFRFPAPTGPYQVGTLTYHWVDAARPEVFIADPAARREIMVQVWYPARGMSSSARAPYVQDAAALAPLARLLHLPPFMLAHLGTITTNAIPGAPAMGGEAYPVLILSHGRAGYRQESTFLVEEMVSHGYVVAAIDHPYAASGVVFPDGRLVTFDSRMLDRRFEAGIVPYLAGDASFTLDQLVRIERADPYGILTGRLDLARTGIVGLSLGGEVTAEACHLDSRFRACLPMDVWMPADVVSAGLRQPTMWLTRDAATMQREGWTPADIARTLDTIRAVYEALPGNGYLVQAPGMYHADFSDAPLLSPLTGWLGISGPIAPQRARDIVTTYSLAFFDRHLRGRPARLLDGPSGRYPELLVESRRGDTGDSRVASVDTGGVEAACHLPPGPDSACRFV
jgi:predicted dienelactone hydrolase